MILDTLKPIPTLWYESRNGKKYYPTEEEQRGCYIEHKDYPEQHCLTPQVTLSVCEIGKGQIFSSNTSINCVEPIVLYLCNVKKWRMIDAIVLASQTCERCLNILLEEVGDVHNYDRKSNTHCDLCAVIDPEYEQWHKEKRTQVSMI